MSRQQYIVAAIVSLGALGLIAGRKLFPSFPVDTTTVGLFGLAVLPWLTLFFKKFKIPGILEGESRDRAQGITEPKPPAVLTAANEAVNISSSTAQFTALSPGSQKILRTLWRYQASNFGSEFSQRWTFKVKPGATEYPDYLQAVADLVSRGYIVVNPENDQCALTNEGIILMSNAGEQARSGDFYIF